MKWFLTGVFTGIVANHAVRTLIEALMQVDQYVISVLYPEATFEESFDDLYREILEEETE